MSVVVIDLIYFSGERQFKCKTICISYFTGFSTRSVSSVLVQFLTFSDFSLNFVLY